MLEVLVVHRSWAGCLWVSMGAAIFCRLQSGNADGICFACLLDTVATIGSGFARSFFTVCIHTVFVHRLNVHVFFYVLVLQCIMFRGW